MTITLSKQASELLEITTPIDMNTDEARKHKKPAAYKAMVMCSRFYNASQYALAQDILARFYCKDNPSEYITDLAHQLERAESYVRSCIQAYAWGGHDEKANLRSAWFNFCNTYQHLTECRYSRDIITRSHPQSGAMTVDLLGKRQEFVTALCLDDGPFHDPWIEVYDSRLRTYCPGKSMPDILMNSNYRIGNDGMLIRRIYGRFTSIAFDFKPEE